MRIHVNLLFLIIVGVLFSVSSSNSQNSFYRTIGHSTQGSEGRNVIEAADGGYFLTYYSYLSGTFVASLTKLNCAGVNEWERFYDGGQVTLPMQIIAQSDNGCLLSFSIQTPSGVWQHIVSKVDSSGNTSWTSRIKMRVGNATGGMVQHSDGSIFICGGDTILPFGVYGTVICKLGINGIPMWQRQYYLPGQHHSPLALTLSSDNKVVVTGIKADNSLPFSDMMVFSTSLDGDLLVSKSISTYYDDESKSIASDNSGNIYITGQSYFLNSQWDVIFVKLNSQFDVIFSKFIDGGTPQGEQARYIIINHDETVTIFGDEGGFNERNPLMMKLDASGNLIWAKRYAVSPSFTNYIFYGAQSSDGGFLMTGDVRPPIQFRIAPFIKTTADGEMGCLTGNFPATVRDESTIALNIPMNFNVVTSVHNSDPLVPASQSIITSNTAFCQQLVPCGIITYQTESTCPKSCFRFFDNSINGTSWTWNFENGTPSFYAGQIPPIVCFENQGTHEVTLAITNAIGTVNYSQFINVSSPCPFNIPNIFTPDGDGINDVFEVRDVAGEFRLSVFNRWGMEVFNSDYPGYWWDGSLQEGNPAPEGVYYYLLSLKVNHQKFSGTLQLIRNP